MLAYFSGSGHLVTTDDFYMALKPNQIYKNGVLVGTASDKYETSNPIARRMVRGFDETIVKLVKESNAKSVLEVGCGEGHVSQLVGNALSPRNFCCTDISDQILEVAKSNMAGIKLEFKCSSVYDLPSSVDPAELVVCCEVLEHLEYPERALDAIAAMATPFALFSVPREPIWRILNLLRGAYWQNLGNTPGHIQHWSAAAFQRFVETQFSVIDVALPLPWTVILARRK